MQDPSPHSAAAIRSATLALDALDAAPRGYRPIEDYAMIGDCHGCALVARDGAIDWAALTRFDADPVACRILDAGKGGFWSIRPVAACRSTRAYLPGTNILRTEFETDTGSVSVTDFMPVGRALEADLHDYVHLNAPGWIVRRIEALRGEVELAIAWRPSCRFAAEPVQLQLIDGAVSAGPEMPMLHGDVALAVQGDCASGRLRLAEGQQRDLVMADSRVEGQNPLSRVDEFFSATRAYWEEWIDYCRYRGPFEDTVRRSALALKLMTYAPTGAIVAAPTTSLPEGIGGGRNWDYRFCWVRDSSFALYALAVLGYSGEAQCFHDYLMRACVRSLPEVRPLYGIDGQLNISEQELDHLEGYEASAPVRTGNSAYLQRQMDVYGQMLDLAHMYQALGGELNEQYRRLLAAVAGFIGAHWQEPDQGIWEMRGPPRHHVHGKLMSWTGLQRATGLIDDKWQAEADRIRDEILACGRDISAKGGGGLQQAYDGSTDAATLLAPMLGFPMPDGLLEKTIDRVKRDLVCGDFVARYSGEDGLEGNEGAFLVCSSWLADAELAAGRIDTARKRIEALVGFANDVGLYAEEVEPEGKQAGRFLGNFPQALTHLGLIGNIANLQLAEKHGAEGVAGSYADRAQRAVGATFGWRAVVAATWQSRKVGRLVSSKKSQLAWP